MLQRPVEPTGSYFNWCRVKHTAGGSVRKGACSGNTPPHGAECDPPYATTVNVNDAIAWIDDQTKPWFLWMAFNAPHSPFQRPPDDCVDPLDPLVPRDCHSQDFAGTGIEIGDLCSGSQDRRLCYEAMLETLDTEVGRLLEEVPDNKHLAAEAR